MRSWSVNKFLLQSWSVLWGVGHNHNIQPYMAILVLQRTGGQRRHPSVTSPLSAFTPSLKCWADWGMFCTSVQINTSSSCHPLGTDCIWAAAQSACLPRSPLSSLVDSGQRHHCMTQQVFSTCKHQTFRRITPKDGTLKGHYDIVFPTNTIPLLSKMWT